MQLERLPALIHSASPAKVFASYLVLHSLFAADQIGRGLLAT
jgi:hypothetical protein